MLMSNFILLNQNFVVAASIAATQVLYLFTQRKTLQAQVIKTGKVFVCASDAW